MRKQKVSVVLLNLGGPDKTKSVKPFLFNLFKDKAIINLPALFRFPLAWLISTLRNKKAQKIYQHLGGKSPLLDYTIEQKNALLKVLSTDSNFEFTIHVCMRYWHPMSDEAVKELLAEKPDHIVLLPLYPQFSTTTTESSFEDIEEKLKKNKHLKSIPIYKINSYEDHPLFIKSHCTLIEEKLQNIPEEHLKNSVLMFSAHGIPVDRIQKGDPYEKHVHKTVSAIMKHFKHLNHEICYQSKVGPKKWLTPSTEERIEYYGKQKTHLIVIPIAFVSEHSETLVELDIDYLELANESGVPSYNRVPALNSEKHFIECLKKLVEEALENTKNASHLKAI